MALTETPRSRVAIRLPSKPAPVTAATVVGFGVLLVCVLVVHGFFWGEIQPMVQTILDSGAIQCLHDQGWSALSATCDSVGEPIGLTFLTGMPETMLGWALSWLPGVDAWTAHQLLNVILDAAALGGGYLLLRRWDVVRGIALVAPAVYLVTPSLIGLNGFQYTFTGYTFLPLYVLLFLRGLDAFAGDRRQRIGVIYLVVDTFLMVFTDGYSYATALLLLGVVLIWWLWRNPDTSRKRKATATAVFAIANLVALAAYTSYINAPADPGSGLGQFRYYSLDPATLFIPVQRASYRAWPDTVKKAAAGIGHADGEGDRLSAVLDKDASVIVVCYFSLLRGGTFWPAPRPDAAALHTAVDAVALDTRIVQRGTFMATVRLHG